MRYLIASLITILISLTVQSPAWATWTHVQGTDAVGSGASSTSVTFGSSVAVGDLVIVAFNFYNSGTTLTSVTDNASTPNTYTLVKSQIVTTSNVTTMMYKTVVTTGGAFTVKVQFNTSAYCPVAIDEYSFTPGTLSITTNSATAFGASPASGNVTFTAPTSLIYAAIGFAASSTFTPAASYTTRGSRNYIGGTSEGVYSQDRLNASSSPQNPGGTLGTSTDWGDVAAAFQSSGDTAPTALAAPGGAALLMHL